ncbi:MAG: hypothetical protein CK424_01540 [Legionella sp.]|nr:MAG: hypothetical protein CK424_01540 [Legionella sp.]
MNVGMFRSNNINKFRQLYKLFAALPEHEQKILLPNLSSSIVGSSFNAIQKKVKDADNYLALNQPNYIRHVAALSEASQLSDQVLAANDNGAELSSEQKKTVSAVYAQHADAVLRYYPVKLDGIEKKVVEALRLDPENKLAADVHFQLTFDPFQIEADVASYKP